MSPRRVMMRMAVSGLTGGLAGIALQGGHPLVGSLLLAWLVVLIVAEREP